MTNVLQIAAVLVLLAIVFLYSKLWRRRVELVPVELFQVNLLAPAG